MNLKILGLLSLLTIGFSLANDFEDDWAEFMRDSNKKTLNKTVPKNMPSKSNRKETQRNLSSYTPPAQQDKKALVKLDYKELYNNFEQYEDLENLDGFIVDREALLKEALDEIALFEEQESERYNHIVKYGAATLACFIVLCAPFIPTQPFTSMSMDTKTVISALGFVGCTTLSVGTIAQACEYKQYKQPLKARHVAIRNWLTKFKSC